MKKVLTICLGAILCGGVLNAKMAEPLQGDEYKKAFKEYFSSDDASFNAHDFEQIVKLDTKFCSMGLADACDTLGLSYAFGLGVKRDTKEAKKYIEYAVKNTNFKPLKPIYEYSLQMLKSTENLSDEEAIKFVKNSFSKNSAECQKEEKESNDKDVCFKAMTLMGYLPHDMLMIYDYSGLAETFYKNDIILNGKESKIEKSVNVYRDIH